MFKTRSVNAPLGAVFTVFGLIFNTIVKDIRKGQRLPIMSLVTEVVQTAVFLLAFLLMFEFLGIRRMGGAIRGDFVLYIMTGIFLFMTHIKAVGAVFGADGPTSPMMQHSPMNTIIVLVSAALGSLCIQTLAMLLVVLVYHVFFSTFEIYDPVMAYGAFLAAWFSGCAIGMALYALKPWAPAFVNIFQMITQRANMIASGKMFVANSLPPSMLQMFDWNPLFHCIDQARGFTFINYYPRNSDFFYPILVSIVLLMIGLLVEYYTRKHASSSWSATS